MFHHKDVCNTNTSAPQKVNLKFITLHVMVKLYIYTIPRHAVYLHFNTYLHPYRTIKTLLHPKNETQYVKTKKKNTF